MLKTLVKTAVVAAALCIVSPFSIVLPFTLVPFSLGVLAVLLCGYVLGPKWGAAAVAVYIALGAVGLPVFSNFSGGLQKLVGPTGGYLLGYFPLVLLAGLASRREKQVARLSLLFAGLVLMYVPGMVWFAAVQKVTLGAAFTLTVLPFIAFDGLKAVAASFVGPVLKRQLGRL